MSITKEAPPKTKEAPPRVDPLGPPTWSEPVKLLVATVHDVTRMFVFWVLTAAIGLVSIRIFHGTHPEGEEIVVLATPLLITFLCFRVLRTTMPPLPEDEIRAPVGVRRTVALGFGLGFLLLLLTAASHLVYRYFAIGWAVTASMFYMKVLCLVLVVVAAVAFCSSTDGKRLLRRSMRAFMTYPDMLRKAMLGPFQVQTHSTKAHATRR